jgi:hypothetical protein
MYPITIHVSDELASRLERRRAQLPHILELGLRELNATEGLQFEGTADVLEFLAGLPDAQAVLDLRPSARLQARINDLLEKNRTIGLSATEEQEWEQYQYLEHLVRMAKLKAHLKLNE